MQTLPLALHDGHLFVTLADARWLLDTGSPLSFGRNGSHLLGRPLELPETMLGVSAQTISDLVGTPCAGVLGMDLLGRLDLLIDPDAGTLLVSATALPLNGTQLPLSESFGVPVLTVDVAGEPRRMFFDTGAQISYLQDATIEGYPFLRTARDFYPGFGTFDTDLYAVPARLDTTELTLHCGMLPPLLGMALMMADVEGIIGNTLLTGRRTTFAPRRKLLVLE